MLPFYPHVISWGGGVSVPHYFMEGEQRAWERGYKLIALLFIAIIWNKWDMKDFNCQGNVLIKLIMYIIMMS